MPTASRQPASRHMKGSVPAEPNPCAFEAMLARIGAIRCRLEGILGQFLTLRISPPAHSETLPMRANGKRDEETHIENQSGPGEEGDEGVETSWRQFGSIFVVLLLLAPPRGQGGRPISSVVLVAVVVLPLLVVLLLLTLLSLGPLGVLLGLSRCPLGALLNGLWALLGLLSGSRGPLGALLGLSWGPLGSFGELLGAILEAIGHKRGGS